MRTLKVFNTNSLSKAEKASRSTARKSLVDLGLLNAVNDPRQVHHADGDAFNNALHNLTAVNTCWHRVLHGGECGAKMSACSADVERRFPSFGMVRDPNHPLGARPVPIALWLHS